MDQSPDSTMWEIFVSGVSIGRATTENRFAVLRDAIEKKLIDPQSAQDIDFRLIVK